jgi:hypothetical protein
MQCVFCTMDKEQIVASNSLTYAVRDTSPVTPPHTLILPHRHVADYFDLDADEKHAIDDLLEERRMGILARDPTVRRTPGLCGETRNRNVEGPGMKQVISVPTVAPDCSDGHRDRRAR